MRYPASEKLEINRTVEQAHQPVKRTLEQIGVSRPTFYLWYIYTSDSVNQRWRVGVAVLGRCVTASRIRFASRWTTWPLSARPQSM